MRASELASLRWSDVDLKHGRVRLDENKTDDPRAWALSPDVTRTLAWWKKRTKGEADDSSMSLDLAKGALAAWQKAGPKARQDEGLGTFARPALRAASSSSAAPRGNRSAARPARHVRHRLPGQRQDRAVGDRPHGPQVEPDDRALRPQARTWAELDLGTLGPLDGLLPEMKGAALRPRKPPGAPGAAEDAALPCPRGRGASVRET